MTPAIADSLSPTVSYGMLAGMPMRVSTARCSEEHLQAARARSRKGRERRPVHPRRHDGPHRVRRGPARRRRVRGSPRSRESRPAADPPERGARRGQALLDAAAAVKDRQVFAIRDIGVIAYAGIPLIDAGGHALGTLCVIDSRPRHWTTDQLQLLSDLATPVVTQIAFATAAAQATHS